MLDVTQYLPAKRKQSASGWISFNAPCCVHNGENADKRGRGGLKVNNNDWSYHCFNCNFKASFTLGRALTVKARKFLEWLGVDKTDIERLNLESLKHKSIEGLITSRQVFEKIADIDFPEKDIFSNKFLENAWEHEQAREYLQSRCISNGYPLLYRDGPGRKGIMIPFTYHDKIVGSSLRFFDDHVPKYINDMPHGYVFGTDLQQDSWQYAIVVEGVFDALSIDGLAVLHNTVNDVQARVIRSLGKEIIVVPDHDRAGLELIDRAVELNWSVSIPDWGEDVKDVNDAVKKFGKLATLITIMQARETSKIKIELRRKQLVKRISN